MKWGAGEVKSQRNMFGEYAERGEYHRYLDPNWVYYPTYLAKMRFIRNYLCRIAKTSRILDLGCGEGVLVEEYRSLGSDIIGLDKDYSSEFVLRGDMRKTPFPDKNFDVILCLDAIEHLDYESQAIAIHEIKRILKDDGIAILSIPNLAHLYSRLCFLLRGGFDRTSLISRHPGDRPMREYIQLLKQEGLGILQRRGLFPTVPLIYQVIQKWPARTLWLYGLLNTLFSFADFCFLNIIIVRKNVEEL